MTDERSEYDVESLRVTREEAWKVLDHQTETISEIHDKGIHILRLNVLLLGLVLTIASILAGSETTPGVNWIVNEFTVAGVVTSVASMIGAVRAYSSTSFRAGTDASDIRAFLRRTPSEGKWLAALLYNYAAWIEQNELANRRNAIALFGSHVLLFLAMGYYVGGLVYGLYLDQVSQWLSLLMILSGIAVGTVLVVPSYFLGRGPFGRFGKRT